MLIISFVFRFVCDNIFFERIVILFGIKNKMDVINVSVIMPVYNPPQEFFRDAVESILNQSYKNFELLIIDDGSDKYIEEIVKSYDDSRIKYYYQENSGVSVARNKGLKLAHGEYVAMADSDDLFDKYRLENN